MNNIPKWLWLTVGGLIAVLLFLNVLDKMNVVSKQLRGAKPDNTISMSAEGRVQAVPDLAIVDLGVLTTASTAKKAQDDNAQAANKVVAFVKSQGIDEKDIATTQLNVYPTYDYSSGQNKITGYQATQNVSVKIRGIDKSTELLGKIIDGAAAAGANQINGANLTFDDPDNLRQEARKQAIAKAKQKAQELADEAGLRLGKIVSISESGYGGYPIPMAYGRGGEMAMDSKTTPSVQPGSQDVYASITVVFEVK